MPRPTDVQKVARALAQVVPSSDAAMMRLRELAIRDVDFAWGTLRKLCEVGNFETIRLEAARLMLTYAAPPPTAVVDVGPQGNARPVVDLARYSIEELQAIKTLQQAQQRIAREDDDQ